jgi:hypothetical protein
MYGYKFSTAGKGNMAQNPRWHMLIIDYINQSQVLNNETIGNGDICCYNCELLKLKLQKMSSELSSAREIIKILQELNGRQRNHVNSNIT